MFREGLLIVFCGPSGVGKGTVLEAARNSNSNIKYSVSATTRSPRHGEKDGENYFFKSVDEFKQMIENGELVEWVEYCGNYYGTPKKYIDDTRKQGHDVVLEIEVEGAANIINKYPDAVSIFILPPSFEELKNRLVGRGTEEDQVIEKRLKRARQELSYVDRYDYVIINDDIDKAVDSFNSILKCEKLLYRRNKNILKEIGVTDS